MITQQKISINDRKLVNKTFDYYADNTFSVTSWPDGKVIDLTDREAGAFMRFIQSRFQYRRKT